MFLPKKSPHHLFPSEVPRPRVERDRPPGLERRLAPEALEALEGLSAAFAGVEGPTHGGGGPPCSVCRCGFGSIRLWGSC